MQIKDRIIDFQRLRGRDLQDNQGNWRTHSDFQRNTLNGLLKQVGITGALLAYHSQRHQGKLTLIDGHLRREAHPDTEWPVLITDLSDDEADLVLATYDPISAMAGADLDKYRDLAERVNVDSIHLREFLRQQERMLDELAQEQEEKAGKPKQTGTDGPPDMELLPFEHYDYIVVIFKNLMDWNQAVEILELSKVRDVKTDKANKIGLAHVVDGGLLLAKLRASVAPDIKL